MSAKEIIKLALAEDLYPLGDLTSSLLITPTKLAKAKIIAKEDGVMACSDILVEVMGEFCNTVRIPQSGDINFLINDMVSFKAGAELVNMTAPAHVVLGAERTILNFLQRSCGIASKTRKLVDKIKDYGCKLLDTRKTIPGLRAFEKTAFAHGGGTNHRFNLSDMVLIKENHLKFMSEEGLAQKLRMTRVKLDEISETRFKEMQDAEFENLNQKQGAKIKIEIEINEENLALLDQVLDSPVDIVMLDNFAPEKSAELIEKIRKANQEIKIELSGGISEETIESHAKTGCDYISTGSVYTNVRNCDLSMLIN